MQLFLILLHSVDLFYLHFFQSFHSFLQMFHCMLQLGVFLLFGLSRNIKHEDKVFPSPISHTIIESHSRTKQPSYRKNDRAMRPIYGALKLFESP